MAEAVETYRQALRDGWFLLAGFAAGFGVACFAWILSIVAGGCP